MSIITQDQYNVCRQTIRNQHIQLDILNFNFQTVDEISGNAIGGSINIDANADIRKTCDVELIVQDSSFDIQAGGRIWLDRYIKIRVGIDSLMTGETIWFDYGTFLIDAPSWQYDATNNTLTFQGLDLMSKLTGLRNGYLPGIPTVIKAGESVRESIIQTITQLGGFTKYVVEECRLSDGTIQSVPYDIAIDQGGTVYDILVALRDVVPNYEIFFDDDVFVYQPVPSGVNETIVADDAIISQNLMSENIEADFAAVKNVTEVYGRAKDVPYFASSVSVSGSTYTLTIADVSAYSDGVMYGFVAPSVVASPYVRIGSLTALPLVQSNGSAAVVPSANEYYVIQYQASSNNFLFLGHLQAYGYAEDNNPLSPFFVGNPAGAIRQVLYGGDYDNIISDELAQQRADYENWLSTRMQDSITLTLVPVHFLGVNQLISHAIKGGSEELPYIIKSISVDLSETGTQSINAIRYYPLYPVI